MGPPKPGLKASSFWWSKDPVLVVLTPTLPWWSKLPDSGQLIGLIAALLTELTVATVGDTAVI